MGNRSLEALTPNTLEKFLALKDRVKDRLWYEIFLTDWYRTAQEQYELYQQGRTKPWNIVTYVDGYNRKSSHQFGVAFDIAFRWKELYPPHHKWLEVGEIAQELWLDRGYKMWWFDRPHFQNTWDKPLKDPLIQEAIDKWYYNWTPWDWLTDRVVLFTMKALKGETHRLQCNCDGECIHGEIPAGQLSSDNGEVSTMRGFNKVKTHNGVITVSVMNEPEEVHKIKFDILLRSAIRNIDNKVDLPMSRVQDWTENASIRIYFVKPWDERLPVAFKEESLAYGIAPAKHKNSGEIYVNEQYDWNTDDYWLRNVLEHEILHTLNIGHSNNPESIMYYKYNKGEHWRGYTEGVINLLKKLY